MSVFGRVLLCTTSLVGSTMALTPASSRDTSVKMTASSLAATDATTKPANAAKQRGGLMRREKANTTAAVVNSNGLVTMPKEANVSVHVDVDELEELDEIDDFQGDQLDPDDGTDVGVAGLTEKEIESAEQDESKSKIERLARMERAAHMGNEAEETMLLKDLTDKTTGGKVIQEVVDIINMVPEPIPESVLKAGVIPTGDDLVHMERLLLPNNTHIVNEETAHDDEDSLGVSNSTGSLQEAGVAGNRSRDPIEPWPIGENGIVDIKYCRSTGLSDQAWDVFKQASVQLHEHCEALDFKEASADTCNLHVQGNEEGCWARLGGDTVNLNHEGWWSSLFKGTCATKGIAEHEILHALGIHHEQTRPDRDSHVVYYPENVQNNYKHNFELSEGESTEEKYDMGSIMHYSCKDFTKSLFSDVLRAKSRRRWAPLRGDCWQMGQRAGLSTTDVEQLTTMYKCSDRRRASSESRRRRKSSRRRWWR